MNVIGKPDVWEMPLTKWFDKNITALLDRTPEYGTIRIEWYQEAFEEESGEFVTVERWNGHTWTQHGLDVHMTVQDLLDLNDTLGGQ